MSFTTKLDAIISQISTNTELIAWCATNFNNQPTMQKYAEFTEDDEGAIPVGQLPYIAFIAGPWDERQRMGGTAYKWRVRNFLVVGLFRHDEISKQVDLTVEFEEHVAEAISDAELGTIEGIELMVVTNGGNAVEMVPITPPVCGFYLEGEIHEQITSTSR